MYIHTFIIIVDVHLHTLMFIHCVERVESETHHKMNGTFTSHSSILSRAYSGDDVEYDPLSSTDDAMRGIVDDNIITVTMPLHDYTMCVEPSCHSYLLYLTLLLLS